ncbi:MAG: hypothetical protein BZY79_02365 [SAR202 cluster bacterium Casp-Chloro-G4]|nr:MAG: hypothetical protein BZY79_02365 [SAR202 cluster bacterium Casp-Chloro-G4]
MACRLAKLRVPPRRESLTGTVGDAAGDGPAVGTEAVGVAGVMVASAVRVGSGGATVVTATEVADAVGCRPGGLLSGEQDSSRIGANTASTII